MNICIITLGSRGDVQPYIALGKGLRSAGHAVTLCTSSSFEAIVREHGLDYGFMRNDLLDLLDSAQGRDAIEHTQGLLGTITTSMKLMRASKQILARLLVDAWEAAQQAEPDVIVYHPKALSGPHIAEKLGIPAFLSLPAPLAVPTGEFPLLGTPALPFGRAYNRWTYSLVDSGTRVYNGIVKAFRMQTLGLPGVKNAAGLDSLGGRPIPVLHAFSRHIVPRPADWPEYAHITGAWFLDDPSWQAPAALQAFLEAGPAPVYVGFGSMAGQNPRHLARIVVAALQQAGVRGFLASGWGGLQADDLPASLFALDQAPHDWLFPRMAAVVHHGGAGTTAAGLRAGKPTVICPFIADQPFWGERVFALGAGPAPIPHKQLTAERLVDAIRSATNDAAMQHSAQTLGQRIREEDGVARAMDIIA